ncbi:MAG: ATP-dependent helicase C-terminal domain-containing protein, partial [Pseudomonadota bacterium]
WLDLMDRLRRTGMSIAEMREYTELVKQGSSTLGKRQALLSAKIAALLTERGLGGRDGHLGHRLEAFDRDRSPRANDARKLADRWVRAAGHPPRQPPLDEALLLAEAFPERIAKARGSSGEFQLATGRGAHVDPTDVLAREKWIAIGELGGGSSRDRILLAAPLDEAALREAFADRLVVEERLQVEADGKVRGRRLLKLDRLTVEDRLIEKPDAAMVARALVDKVRREGLAVLPLGDRARGFITRAGYLHAARPDVWPDLSEPALLARLDDWLEPLLTGKRALGDLSDDALADALRTQLPWDLQQKLDAEAPSRWQAPTGSRFRIDYGAEGGPRVEARVMELYGLSEHPKAAGVPLTLALLSPGHKPIQITKDLPGFWRGSWKEVRTEMKGRYPRHVWPEEPWLAQATTRAKPRGT